MQLPRLVGLRDFSVQRLHAAHRCGGLREVGGLFVLLCLIPGSLADQYLLLILRSALVCVELVHGVGEISDDDGRIFSPLTERCFPTFSPKSDAPEVAEIVPFEIAGQDRQPADLVQALGDLLTVSRDLTLRERDPAFVVGDQERTPRNIAVR